jgi:phosphatidylinositol-3-phosphatase
VSEESPQTALGHRLSEPYTASLNPRTAKLVPETDSGSAWWRGARAPALPSRGMPTAAAVASALVVAACLAGCGTASERSAQRTGTVVHPRACGTQRPRPGAYEHVVWIVMENRSYSKVMHARYIRALAANCGLATNYRAVAHPSLPNYIAMTSGSTQGVTDDADPSAHRLAASSIFSQLGRDWRSLEESMPSPCKRQNSGAYVAHHNPAAYYTRLRRSCAARDVPLANPPDLSARFTFITPNRCNDMHDCGITRGDRWLATWMPRIFRSHEYRSGRTAVFLTWDEDDGTTGNHVLTLVISPRVRTGTRSGARFDHYSLLRTTEELLGLPARLGAARSAPDMRAAFGL